MRAVVLGLVGAMVLVGAAEAENAVYSAKSENLDADLKIATDSRGNSIGKYALVSHGCIGEVSGALTVASPSEMLLTERVGNNICKIRLVRKGKSVVAQEDGDCSYFRGASCEFSQVLYRRR